MASLDRLLARLGAKHSARYADGDGFPFTLRGNQQPHYNGYTEVQACAVERDRQGRVIRALCWDGTQSHLADCWGIRDIASRKEAEFCGILDHGYA